MPTLKNRQRVGLGDFSGVRRQQPMRQNGCSLTRLFLAGILSQLYALYGALSAHMMNVIARFGARQHVYSIDESFLSFNNCEKAIPCFTRHAHNIRRTVWKETRLPVCVGIGKTLTLAKVANHAAKKVRGYNGVCFISDTVQRKAILSSMATNDVWGIGSRISKRLQAMNVNTALDLANMPPSLAGKTFSIEVERTVRELNGEACKGWDEARADKKQIFSTRSVGQRITDKASLLQALSKHAGIAASKARQQGSMCKTLMVFAHNSPFDERPAGFKYIYQFEFPTNDTVELTKACSLVAEKLYRPDISYYKIGVGLLNLCPQQNLQKDLFAEASDPALMQAYDLLNARYGSNTVFLAAQGIEQKWKMKRDYMTPQYTSRWSDIPKIRC